MCPQNMLSFYRGEKKRTFSGHCVPAVRNRPTRQVVVPMMSVQRYIDLAQHWVGELGPREWTVVAVAMLVVGLFCLRGLGVNRTY